MGEFPSRLREGLGAGATAAPDPVKALPRPLPQEGGELIRAARLLASVSSTPRLDAELLLAHAMGITREALLLGPERAVPPSFDGLLERRLAHEPVAFITGERAFWTLDLHVTPDVLIPRPDSETLIEAALAHFAGRAPTSILDLGAGSGALLLAAMSEWPQAWGLGVDRSAAELAVARGNAERLGLPARFVLGDWAAALDGRFDLILCNPPYVETGADLPPEVRGHEPHGALFAGEDGLDDYRRLAPQVARLLAPEGFAAVEIGAVQGEAAGALFRAAGLAVSVRQDLAAHDRCLQITCR